MHHMLIASLQRTLQLTVLGEHIAVGRHSQVFEIIVCCQRIRVCDILVYPIWLLQY